MTATPRPSSRRNASRMVSPAELHRAACAEYLDGRSPTTRTEWQYCVNYWAANLAAGLEVEACKLLGLIMECPLSATEISEIAAFQAGHKKGKASQ